MQIWRLIVPLVALFFLGLVVARAVAKWRRSGVSPVAPDSPLSGIAQRAALWRAGGLILGALVGVRLAFAPADWLGLGAVLAAPVFSLFMLAGVLVGEATVRFAPGVTRAAAVEVRSVRDYLPPAMTRWVAAMTVTLAALLVTTSVTASSDDLGRAGRQLSLDCGGGRSVGSSPWPGVFYSVPIAVAVLAGLAAAALVLHRIARRPRPDAGADLDDRLRRRSGEVVMAACGLLVGVSLAGTALQAGAILVRLDCGPLWLRVLGWPLLGIALAAIVSIGVFGVAAFVRERAAARIGP